MQFHHSTVRPETFNIRVLRETLVLMRSTWNIFSFISKERKFALLLIFKHWRYVYLSNIKLNLFYLSKRNKKFSQRCDSSEINCMKYACSAFKVWYFCLKYSTNILLQAFQTADACFVSGALSSLSFFGFLITTLVSSLLDSVTDIRRQPISWHDVPLTAAIWMVLYTGSNRKRYESE